MASVISVKFSSMFIDASGVSSHEHVSVMKKQTTLTNTNN